MNKNRIVLVGACYIDTVLTVPHYPEEDTKLRAISLIERRGGNCPNTLEVLQQLFRRRSEHTREQETAASLIAVLPKKDAAHSTYVRNSFIDAGSLAQCIHRERNDDAASSYIIRSKESDSRTIVNYNDLPEMTFDEFREIADSIASDASLYHFEGRIPEVIGSCIRYLKRTYPDVRISLEAEKPGRPGLAELVPEADIVLFSKSWATNAGYNDPQSFLRHTALRASEDATLLCTWADAGAAVLDRSVSDEAGHRPSFKLNQPVIDTVGAGDTFTAGFLFSCLCGNGWSLSQRLDFANELAGRKVIQEGFTGLADVVDGAWFLMG